MAVFSFCPATNSLGNCQWRKRFRLRRESRVGFPARPACFRVSGDKKEVQVAEGAAFLQTANGVSATVG